MTIEYIKAIAMLCQIYSNSSKGMVELSQQRCQSYYSKCLLETDIKEHYSFLKCIEKRP